MKVTIARNTKGVRIFDLPHGGLFIFSEAASVVYVRVNNSVYSLDGKERYNLKLNNLGAECLNPTLIVYPVVIEELTVRII